jgi:hypothetical protein
MWSVQRLKTSWSASFLRNCLPHPDGELAETMSLVEGVVLGPEDEGVEAVVPGQVRELI